MLGAIVVIGASGLAACGGDDDDARVEVTLSEWIVEPAPADSAAGEIEFVGDNVGAETHELVVIRADSADGLPTDDDGAVVEDDLEAGALIGEIEDVLTKTSKSVTLELEAGNYVLLCNITEEETDGTIESHFEKGMHAEFTVE